jgi:hypothetical protein
MAALSESVGAPAASGVSRTRSATRSSSITRMSFHRDMSRYSRLTLALRIQSMSCAFARLSNGTTIHVRSSSGGLTRRGAAAAAWVRHGGGEPSAHCA